MYFPQYLSYPADFISLWFLFRAEEKESCIWQALLLKPTPIGAALLVQSLRPVTLLTPGKPQFQTFPSSHQGELFAEDFGCSWRFLSLFSLKVYFVGLEHWGFFLSLHTDVSGSQDVHLWSWVTGERCSSFIYSKEECVLHMQMFKMVILFPGLSCRHC